MKKHARTIILMVVAVFVIAVLAFSTGCAKKEEAPTGVAPVRSSEPASLDDPEAVLQQECTMCHSLDAVHAKKGDVKEWQRTIKRMNEQYGATVSDENAKVIPEYLGSK